MEKGDHVIIKDTKRNNTHPAGTKAVIILICELEDRPYYCQTTEGRTCYWYSKEELSIMD